MRTISSGWAAGASEHLERTLAAFGLAGALLMLASGVALLLPGKAAPSTGTRFDRLTNPPAAQRRSNAMAARCLARHAHYHDVKQLQSCHNMFVILCTSGNFAADQLNTSQTPSNAKIDIRHGR